MPAKPHLADLCDDKRKLSINRPLLLFRYGIFVVRAEIRAVVICSRQELIHFVLVKVHKADIISALVVPDIIYAIITIAFQIIITTDMFAIDPKTIDIIAEGDTSTIHY